MDAYIIYNPEYNASVKVANTAISACTKHNVKYNLFEGINVSNVDELISKYKLKPRPTNSGYIQRLHNTPGTQGCFMSHFLLWDLCKELDKPIIILEHDGLIIRDIPKDLEWSDILDLAPKHPGKYRGEIILDLDDTRIPKVIPHVHALSPTAESIAGAYAYAIKPSGAIKLIKSVYKLGWTAADSLIHKSVVDIQMVDPQIAILDTTYEDSLTDPMTRKKK